MSISPELIEHVALLARLSLTEEEKAQFAPQLKEILEAFSALDEVDTEHVPSSFHPVILGDRMRDDTPLAPLSQEQALRNIPPTHSKEGYIKGPRTLSEE